jgi:formylglycine-generating enzyme required for sulfatase activity
MQYEASRPDATSSSAGTMSHVACSRPDVVPWTSVTWDEAQAACCALNPGGLCPAPGSSGWRLCDAADWQVACRGPSGSCGWSYASMCASSQPLVCNGQEHDCDPALAGDQDCLYNTGSSTFPNCYTDWGGGSRLFDMSGNVKEWTATAVSPGIYQVRGGSYQTIEAGRACTFDFTVADHTFSSNNMGFRCCLY